MKIFKSLDKNVFETIKKVTDIKIFMSASCNYVLCVCECGEHDLFSYAYSDYRKEEKIHSQVNDLGHSSEEKGNKKHVILLAEAY